MSTAINDENNISKKIDNPIYVMIVDDSAVARGLETRMLESDPAIKVVASVANGEMAVKILPRHEVDVIVLDIEMPVMDGITALPLLLAVKPDVQILMASTLTQRNAEKSMEAMTAGATDYIPKPTTSGLSGADEFSRELITKVKVLGQRRSRVKSSGVKIRPPRAPASSQPDTTPKTVKTDRTVTLREPGNGKPEIVVIGSSTGGPQALLTFIEQLDPTLDVPIIITQHMPPTFTKILTEHITKKTPWPCTEGQNGMALQDNHIILAPGDYHMTVVQKGPQREILLNQEPPENFCRPAVDPMFRSAVKIFGANILGIILTGMGTDGCKGAQQIVEAGGTLIAQDEASSVVWGMPGAVAIAGLCSTVLPLKELADYANRFVKGNKK